MEAMLRSDIKSLPLIHRGKVRDIYDAGNNLLLVVQTDRLSAFDVILDDPIAGKGAVLTAMSNFWFEKFAGMMPTQMTGIDPSEVLTKEEYETVKGRSVVVKRLKPLPIEAVVRGYISGSLWKEYQKTGEYDGIKLPAGLKQSDKLPEVLFTPTTKAAVGDHDEPITYPEMEKLIGADIAKQVRDMAVSLYKRASEYAATRGIVIADTKFEFGLDEKGTVHLIDEILTPDSSRFWPADQVKSGETPPSFDKQFVRDWLDAQPWDKQAPAPRLPEDVKKKTVEKYYEALKLLGVTGGK